MGQKSRTVVFMTLLVGAIAIPISGNAQQHDKEKYKQIRSMEVAGNWDFSPGMYYYVMHKKYSGASLNWFKVKFKESKASGKPVNPIRASQIPVEAISANHIDHQIDSIQPLVTEETIRFAERNIDPIYPMYKDDFIELGNSISEALLFAIEESNGLLTKVCEKLQMEYDTICSEIEYIHQTGPGNEVEPTKRQLVYEDAKERLTNLAKSCSSLAYYATTL